MFCLARRSRYRCLQSCVCVCACVAKMFVKWKDDESMSIYRACLLRLVSRRSCERCAQKRDTHSVTKQRSEEEGDAPTAGKNTNVWSHENVVGDRSTFLISSQPQRQFTLHHTHEHTYTQAILRSRLITPSCHRKCLPKATGRSRFCARPLGSQRACISSSQAVPLNVAKGCAVHKKTVATETFKFS